MKVSSTFPKSFCITFCLNKGVPREFLCIRCLHQLGQLVVDAKFKSLRKKLEVLMRKKLGALMRKKKGDLAEEKADSKTYRCV